MARRPQKASIAAALGVTAGRVSQLIKRGMPTDTIDGALAWYRENIRETPRDTPDAAPPRAGTMADAKTREIEANAALKELELARKVGTITDRAGVERAAYQFGRILQKTLIDVWPSKVSMELATLTDPWQIECFVRDRLRQELAAVSKMTTEEVAGHV